MLLRASLFLLLLHSLAACGHNSAGKLAVDTPIMPYTPPDADELAGIDDEDDAEEEETTDDEGTPPAPDPAPTAPVVPASSPPPAPKAPPKK